MTKNSKTLFNQFDIVQVISSYIKLNKKGDNYWGICPFHQDTKPSLSVSQTKQIYKCFACENSGNAISFVMKYKQVSFFDAINEIKNILNLDIDLNEFYFDQKLDESKIRLFNLNDLVANWYEAFLQNKEFKNIVEYLKDRKINQEAINKFRIGFAPNKQKQIFYLATNKDNIRQLIDDKNVYSMNEMIEANLIFLSEDGNVFDTFNNRIIFPIIDLYNNVIGFSSRTLDANNNVKYLNTKTNDIFKKNETFYNINNFDVSKDYVYIVEGFFDVISLDIIGIKNVLCTMGVSFSEEHKKILKETLKVNKVILAYDNDSAGKAAMIKTALVLDKLFDIFVIDYQTELKDFNDLLVKDEQELRQQINQIKDFCLFYLQTYLNSNDENEILVLNQKYMECLKIVRKFGKKVYFVDYLNFFKTYFKVPEDIIFKDIKTVLYINRYDTNIVQKNYLLKNNDNYEIKAEQNIIYSIKLLEKQIDNIFEKLLQFCLYSVDFFEYIYENYTFDNKNIDVYNSINTILNFYDSEKNIKSITLNLLNFQKFCIQNNCQNSLNFLQKIISYQIINNVNYKSESIQPLLNKLNKTELDLKIKKIWLAINSADIQEDQKTELIKKLEQFKSEYKKIN